MLLFFFPDSVSLAGLIVTYDQFLFFTILGCDAEGKKSGIFRVVEERW
jgi:hypothetical protein